MLDLGAFDRRREIQRFLEVAVRDLHLLIRNARGARPVFAAAGNVEHISSNIDLDVLGRNASQLDLYDPTVRRLIDIRRRIPKLPATNILRRAGELKISIDRFCHCLTN